MKMVALFDSILIFWSGFAGASTLQIRGLLNFDSGRRLLRWARCLFETGGYLFKDGVDNTMEQEK